ncbi:protein kinase C and casein kinase substrate in neurons protein 2 isoform X2 [Pieris napi]|uniref:protein kinase C and casein kinase substrate in neurons protein 2 isoform X2 n=1 Tax=Pieris napi TaxID=78633 RepID=UPI001FB9B93F|nr:protein kinase C and casein kinase substrate in neurons protein 2 isoform X2 [Pieris napi]
MAKLCKKRGRRCRSKMHHLMHTLGGAVCECRTAMSHHSDEQAMLSVTSDSFWEPGNYKRTTKRVDDGHRLCSELQGLVQERAEIEKTYAKSLRGWAKKWNDLIEKGPEYGTMEAAWKGGMVEAERLSDLHLSVRDRLVNDVMAQIKNWQKDTYHKSMIQLKERKEMDEAFKKAQKPWAKFLQKVERARMEYHTACKQERTAQNQERNASGDSSLSPDQIKKMAERVTKCRDDVAKSRDKYQAALAEITAYNPRYIEDMTGVFDRCQQMEAQRLVFFKDVLFSFHKCLNISQEPILPQIYEEFHHTINNADHQKDLKWWANNHGINMAMAWPQFEDEPSETTEPIRYKYLPAAASAVIDRVVTTARRPRNISVGALWSRTQRHLRLALPSICFRKERDPRVAPSDTTSVYKGEYFTNSYMEYTEEFRDIAKGKSKESLPTGPITLLNQRPVSEDELPPITNNKVKANHTEPVVQVNNAPSQNSTANNTIDKKSISAPIAVTNGTASAPKSNKSSPVKEPSRQDNPFEEEEWEEESGGPLTDTGEPGVPVRALYDYTGAESDELSFRQGDLFEKLEDEDEQGWCKGRKDGRVGLYPANYVEPVGH